MRLACELCSLLFEFGDLEFGEIPAKTLKERRM